MPEAVSYIISVPTTGTTVGVRGGASANGGSVTVPVPVVSPIPIQIAGLVPMEDCTASECRDLPKNCCENLKVFGQTETTPTPPFVTQAVQTSTYENDLNDFRFDIQLPGQTGQFTIEKCVEFTNVDVQAGWQQKAVVTNNNYGAFQAKGTISGHPNYIEFIINWGKVFVSFGFGNYRIKFSFASSGSVYTGCFVSPCFELRKFNCKLATKTVKFEMVNSSTIGKCDNKGYVFDMCGMNAPSYIRLPGVFGTNTIPKYDEVYNKWQNGKMEMVHNEAIQKWKFNSLKISKPYHDRLKTYFMMAAQRFVSDYNIFNVDYDIKKLCVVPAGPYEPVDYNTALPPQSIVAVEFNSGIQNIIASNCCNLK